MNTIFGDEVTGVLNAVIDANVQRIRIMRCFFLLRARVDVHRKDNMGSLEKAITIYGQPENCTNACHQILNVMQEEAKNTGKPEDIPLKVLAHNNLIGRIIGKQGTNFKFTFCGKSHRVQI